MRVGREERSGVGHEKARDEIRRGYGRSSMKKKETHIWAKKCGYFVRGILAQTILRQSDKHNGEYISKTIEFSKANDVPQYCGMCWLSILVR